MKACQLSIQYHSLKTQTSVKVKYYILKPTANTDIYLCELCIMECFLIKYLQIGKAAINRRDECLRKMKDLFTSIRYKEDNDMCNCIANYNRLTTHRGQNNYSRLEIQNVGVGMLQWSVLLVGRS